MRAAGTLLVSGLACVLAFAGAETVARRANALGCRSATASVAASSPFYGWGNLPGASGWSQGCLADTPEWRTFVQINSRGLHDREIPYERTGARRILVLGDSFTAALMIDAGDNFSKRLEAALNAPDSPGSRVEVVNAGVPAWGTDNALLFFENEGWRYRPDVVILAFDTSNDVFENDRDLVTSESVYPDKPYFRLLDGRLVRMNYPLPQPSMVTRGIRWLYQLLQARSVLVARLGTVPVVWRYLQSPAAREPGLPTAHPWQVYLRDYPEHWREAWRITRGLVLRLRQVVEAHGASFVVVVVNGREEVSPARMDKIRAIFPDLHAGVDADKPNRLITGFLARRGIATIPLLGSFRADYARDARPAYFQYDVHWTAVGHAVAATAIERGLGAYGLLDVPVAAR